MITSFAWIEKKKVLDLYFCEIKNWNDYRKYRNSFYEFKPSYNGYDGGAGSRYQCTREVKSFWYPTWLAQLAALVEGSRLVDAPARGLTVDDILPMAKEYEFLVLYTSTPSFPNDVKIAAVSYTHLTLPTNREV